MITNKTRNVLSLFRTNRIIGILLVAAYAVLLRISFLWSPLPVELMPEPSPLAFEWLWAAGPAWSYWLATLLVVIQALFLNELLNFYRLSENRTYLPAAAYVLFCSLLPEFLPLSPEVLANTFLLFTWRELFRTYKSSKVSAPLFNTGFWLALTVLVSWQYIVFALWLFIGWRSLRSFNLREGLVILSGFFTPCLLVGTWLFWSDRLPLLWQEQILQQIAFFDLTDALAPALITTAKLSLTGLLFLLLLANTQLFYFKQKIHNQKIINLIYWGLLVSAGVLLLQKDIHLTNLLVAAPASGMLLGLLLLKISDRWAETLHWLLVFLLLFFHYWPLLPI